MKPRVSSGELRRLRNRIPIDRLIAHGLGIPSKHSEGYFRFLCPWCGEFQTAVNPRTNMARCFLCNKNLNTIDMVMAARSMGFIQSVKFLKQYYDSIAYDSDTVPHEQLERIHVPPPTPVQISSPDRGAPHHPLQKATHSFVPIGRILPTLPLFNAQTENAQAMENSTSRDQGNIHPPRRGMIQKYTMRRRE